MGTTLFTANQLAEGGASGGGGVFNFGCNEVGETTTTRFLRPAGFAGVASTTEEVTPYPQLTGTLKNLVISNNVVGVGGNITYTVLKNSVATDLAVTMLASDAQGTSNSGTETVVFGDELSIEITKAGTITTSPFGISASIGVV